MQRAPDIWQFNDYRAYLLAYAQTSKRDNPRWSFGIWTRRLGLADTSSLTKIIRGQRNPSDKCVEKFVSFFAMKDREAEYFRDLVRLNKIKRDPGMRQLLLEKLVRQTGRKGIETLDDKAFTVVSNWFCFAVLEMTSLDSFLEDPQWISRKFHFKVTPRQVRQAIEALLSLGLLQRNPKGRLQIAHAHVHTTNDVSSEAIRHYHLQMLDNAKSALRKFSVNEREFSSATFVMDASKMSQAKELIRGFKTQLEELLAGEGSGQVFQFQMQLFPITKGEK